MSKLVPIQNARRESIAKKIVDAAFTVHTELGPGLLENVYEICLMHELRSRGMTAQRQVELPIRYGNVILDGALKLDLLVEGEIVLEIKAVERLLPVHLAQLLTYLKLADKRLGFLLNFNVSGMKQGVRRVVL